ALDMNQPLTICQVGIYTGIHDLHIDPAVSRQHIDCRPTTQEIVYHLSGYLARIRADAFSRDAVISGNDVDALASDARCDGLLYRGETIGDLFNPTEAARRLGQGELPLARRSHPGLVEGCDLIADEVDK